MFYSFNIVPPGVIHCYQIPGMMIPDRQLGLKLAVNG